MAVENDLGKDRISRLVWRIAVPSMLAQFVSVFYSIVDRMYVGNIPDVGDIALAGVGVCGPVVTLLGSVAFLVGIGGSPMLSIQLGAGRKEQAEKILANSFLMLCILAVILTGIVLPFRKPMLLLFGASSATYPYAVKYFTIYLCGTVFALLASGLNQFIICQGFAVVGMKSVVLGALLNIALDPLFIFVFRMGVQGAALATVLSQAASAVYVLFFLFGRRVFVRITFGSYDLRLMGKIILMGLTPFIIIAIDNVMIIAMNAVLQKYGGAEADSLITCNAIVQSFMLVLTMPLSGISGGTQSILSYNFGAGQPKRVYQAQRYIALMCAGFAAIIFVLARVMGGLFASLFTKDAVLIEQAVRAINICTLAIIPLGIQYEIVDGFTALGQVHLALPLSLWRKLTYFTAVFALPVFFGAEAVFYAEPISDVLGPFMSILIYVLSIRKVLGMKRERKDSRESCLKKE